MRRRQDPPTGQNRDCDVLASQSMIFILACITSVPMPSPGNTMTLRFDAITYPLFLDITAAMAAKLKLRVSATSFGP
jgi:hypothetical protein